MLHLRRAFLSFMAVVSCLLVDGVAAQDKGQPAAKSRQLVEDHLKKLGATPGQLLAIDDVGVTRSFPGEHFFTARFPVYPVARVIPAGLRAANIFVVGPERKVQLLKDDRAVEQFFKAHLAPLKDADAARNAVRAWLRLAEEHVQDGFFKFEILTKEINVEADGNRIRKAGGRSLVIGGGKGEITVTMELGDGNRLERITGKAKVQPGVRPICQATLLLDANPLVRAVAEQDLLVMGMAARDYLLEQRERAGPELREAIDRIWQRIVARER